VRRKEVGKWLLTEVGWVSQLPPSFQGRAVGRVEATLQMAPNRAVK